MLRKPDWEVMAIGHCLHLPRAAIGLALWVIVLAAPRLSANEPRHPDQPGLVWTRPALIEAFQDIELVPRNGGFLMVGTFPEWRWEQPFLVDSLWGEAPLTVRWFDANGEEVSSPRGPGRYAAYIEARPENGPVIRRARTVFAFDPEVAAALFQSPPLEMPKVSLPGFSPDAWEAHGDELDQWLSQTTLTALLQHERAAVFVASTAEWDADAPMAGVPNIADLRHQEHHLAVKRRILGVEDKYPPLEPRPPAAEAAPVLGEGSPAAAGFADDLPDQLRAFAGQWHEQAGEPFTLVVARRGVVVFHEPFGQRAGEPVSRDTAYGMFSISKSVTGLMLMHLLDRGLLELDLGSGVHLRAIDLARLGQVILNRGRYGDYILYREESADLFLPVPYETYFPGLAPDAADYGLGIRMAGEPHPRAGENGIPEGAVIPSARTVGHGAFGGSIFRVDLEHDIVVTMGRFGSGDDYGENLLRLLLIVTEAIVD